jgi:hypothetical protein
LASSSSSPRSGLSMQCPKKDRSERQTARALFADGRPWSASALSPSPAFPDRRSMLGPEEAAFNGDSLSGQNHSRCRCPTVPLTLDTLRPRRAERQNAGPFLPQRQRADRDGPAHRLPEPPSRCRLASRRKRRHMVEACHPHNQELPPRASRNLAKLRLFRAGRRCSGPRD